MQISLNASNPTWAVQAYLACDSSKAQSKAQLLDNIFSLALAKSLQKVRMPIVFEVDGSKCPSTGKAIKAAYDKAMSTGEPMPIFAGSVDSLYWSVRTNLMYRVLHDYDHATHMSLGCGTTKLADEQYLNGLMLWRVMCLPVSDAYRYTDILDCVHAMYYDLIATQDYYHENGEFVADQYTFVQERMSSYYARYTTVSDKLASAKLLLRKCGIDFGSSTAAI